MGFCAFYFQSSKESNEELLGEYLTGRIPLGPEWKDPLIFSKAFQITTIDNVRFFIFKLFLYKISCIPYMIYKLMCLINSACVRKKYPPKTISFSGHFPSKS